MKMKYFGSLLAAAFGLSAHAQQQPLNSNPGSAPGTLPPGLGQRQQLPPGLSQPAVLPPGLQNQQVQVPGQGAAVAAYTTNAAVAPASPFATSTNANVALSNQAAATNGMLTAAATNVIFITNPYPASASSVGGTPRSSGTLQDQAATVADQNLLNMLRKRVPIVANGATADRLRFIAREGVVTLIGQVPTERESQRIVEFVQRTPGVVQVVNQLYVIAEGAPDANPSITWTPDPQAQPQGAFAAAATNGVIVTNSFGLILTNRGNPIAGARTNFAVTATNALTTTNLSPTGRTNSGGRTFEQNQSLPPGLRQGESLPPGLERRQTLPPGLQDRSQSQPR